MEHAIASGAVPPGGGQLLDALHDAGQITAVAESAVGESKVYVLEGNVPESDGETPMFSRFVATIDQETGALHKLELFERPQVKTATITLKDFDFSPSIDPASFDVSAAETEAAN
ncbi:MAG: hypothetical protein GC168_15385 [Candidatus Hydrogenedens sp.]|nr:hypothetical protein [Candidatus Hydrogenedens sp.]